MKYVVILLICIVNIIPQHSGNNSDKVDLEITMEPVKTEKLKNGDRVTLEFMVKNISEVECPENSYKFTLFINNELVSLDNKTPKLLPQETVTYSKQSPNHHFIFHKDSSYHIVAKIQMKEGYKDLNLTNNEVDLIVAKR